MRSGDSFEAVARQSQFTRSSKQFFGVFNSGIHCKVFDLCMAEEEEEKKNKKRKKKKKETKKMNKIKIFCLDFSTFC